jgi:hypothetical protein
MSLSDLESKLDDALSRFKWSDVEELCKEIVKLIRTNPTSIDAVTAKGILAALRRKRQFMSMMPLAEVMIRSGVDTSPVRRLYAQALIDQGVFTPAERLVESVLANPKAKPFDIREAHGHIGRIYKQLYVDNNDPASAANRLNLEHALKEYYDVYANDRTRESWYQGINAVALLARAKRDGVPLTGYPQATDLAREILAAIDEEKEQKDSLPAYDWATKVEAHVALGEIDDALRTASIYLSRPDADAFEVFSTLRQFIEVWQLTETEPPGSLLLPVLRSGYLKKSGAAAEGKSEDVQKEAEALDANMDKYEAVFGPDRMQTLKWYRLGLKRCESVARIERRDGRGHGTGWLVNAADFFPGREGVLVLTNAHVISEHPNRHPKAIGPKECRVNFQTVDETGEILDVKEKVYWSSPYSELDATFLELTGEPKAKPLPLYSSAMEIKEPPPRMYIIGHPSGRDVEFSLQDNYLVACNETFVHYRTPTEPGSSGSPVFEPVGWEVVALHHRGTDKMKRIDGKDGFYEANEGVSILRIQAETRKPGSGVGV